MKQRKQRKSTDTPQSEKSFFAPARTAAQQNAGEQADFFQPPLKMSRPGDRSEQEADRIADVVTSRNQSAQAAQVSRKRLVQRQSEQEDDLSAAQRVRRQQELDDEPLQAQLEDEEEAVQTQLEDEEEAVQTQLEDEEEAVQTQLEDEEEAVQTQLDQEDETVQAQLDAEEETVRTQSEEDEEAVQTKVDEEEQVQAKPLRGGPPPIVQAKSRPRPAGPAFVSLLQQRKGNGRPLPPDTLAEMESSFQADFSQVRIHTDQAATELSEMIGAQAFTHGNEIFFNRGRFAPETSSGQHLLAHELTHTLQQQKQQPDQ